MGIFDGYLLCSDFDGTMAEKAQVSQENCDAIAYFQREGGIFCPTSGRLTSFFHSMTDRFRANGPVITLNGTSISIYAEDPAEDEQLYLGYMPNALMKEYVSDALTLEGVNYVWVYQQPNVCLLLPEGKEVHSDEGRRILTTLDEIEGDALKIVIGHDKDHLPEIRAALEPKYRDRLAFGSSWDTGYEAQLLGTTKGDSVLRVKKMVGAHTLVCVGDYENDLTMIKSADIGYAVGNAVDCLKEAADRITVPNTEHAIARIVSDLERDIRARAENR